MNKDINNKKYYIVTNRDMATTLSMLTGQRPYIYPDKFDDTRSVFSFINDCKFKEIFDLVNKLIEENRK